jgi:PPK2 family polyphosphate:nucleotide phosphotransferase
MAYTFKIQPAEKVRLKHYDPEHTGGLTREQGEAKLAVLSKELDVLQEELYAAGLDSVLVILQGMDTSGKDGAIRHVFEPCNPQGINVTSFKVPTAEELGHDFLWRIHQQTPERGMIGVFNRSHYEDVLVVRVHELVSKKVWRARYEQINHFESMLAQNRTLIFKFYLHISREEQEQRLLAREQDVAKAWKLSVGDWKERAYWDRYIEAYEDALSLCNTEAAPWQIVPANAKWFRNVAIAQALVDGLRPRRKKWQARLAEISTARLAELKVYRDSL